MRKLVMIGIGDLRKVDLKEYDKILAKSFPLIRKLKGENNYIGIVSGWSPELVKEKASSANLDFFICASSSPPHYGLKSEEYKEIEIGKTDLKAYARRVEKFFKNLKDSDVVIQYNGDNAIGCYVSPPQKIMKKIKKMGSLQKIEKPIFVEEGKLLEEILSFRKKGKIFVPLHIKYQNGGFYISEFNGSEKKTPRYLRKLSKEVGGVFEDDYYIGLVERHKGEAIKEFIEKEDLNPEKIIFISQGSQSDNEVRKYIEDVSKDIAIYAPKNSKISEKKTNFKTEGEKHYTYYEILSQPQILEETLNQDVSKIARKIDEGEDIYLVGCGSSYFAALYGDMLFSKTGRDSRAFHASESEIFTKEIKDGDVVIFLSQSGETYDVLKCLEDLKEKDIYKVAITNSPISTLSLKSDDTINLKCGVETGVAATKSFSAELLILHLLENELGGNYSISEIKKIPKHIDKFFKKEKKEVEKVANFLKNYRNAFLIGRGLSYPISLEISLKLKELVYEHGEGVEGGELKHGPLALVSESFPSIVLHPSDETYKDISQTIEEIKSREGKIISITDKKDEHSDYTILIPNCEIPYVLEAVTGQLLAYSASVKKGINPDKPRHLAKIVTVV